jgi:hypothetical protein
MPLRSLDGLSSWIDTAVKSSAKFAEERDQQQPATNCVAMLIRSRDEDGSLIITVGKETLHNIRAALEMFF